MQCFQKPKLGLRWLFAICLVMHLGTSPVEAQWWKFWKKKDTQAAATESAPAQTAPEKKDTKAVEAERRAAERALKKEQRKALKAEKERQEALIRQTEATQKEIERNQRKIIAQNKKNQRKLMRDLKAKSRAVSGKKTSFFQRLGFKKKSSDNFFLSE